MNIEIYQFVASVLSSLLMGGLGVATISFTLRVRGESMRERLIRLEQKFDDHSREVLSRLKNIEARMFPINAPGGE